MSDQFEPPSLPDPVKAAELASLGRHALTFAGAMISAFGMSMPTWLANLTDPQITNIVMGGMFFGGLAMSAVGFLRGRLDKWRSRQLLVASAKASAQKGEAVTVAVTPDGQDNVATKISVAEQVAAPSVPQGVAPQPAPAV